MTEHQDLGVVGRLRPGEQGDPAEHTKKNQVEQAYGHRSHPAGAQAPVPAKPQIRPCDTVTSTHTVHRNLRVRMASQVLSAPTSYLRGKAASGAGSPRAS